MHLSLGFALSPDSGGWSSPAPAEPTNADRCATDTSLWITVVGEGGRCYNVCTVDPSQTFEVSCSQPQSQPQRRATSGTIEHPPGTIIEGVPDWVVIGGLGALAVILMNR